MIDLGSQKNKERLRKTLNSATFKRRFRSMVAGSKRNGCEHRLGVNLEMTRFKKLSIKVGPVDKGYLGSMYDPMIESAPDEIAETMHQVTQGIMSIPIVGIHTHPFRMDSEGALINIPSAADVQVSTLVDCFSIVVPVDVQTGDFNVIAFQPLSLFSHVSYDNLIDEIGMSAPDFDRRVLWHAQERGILRAIYLSGKSRPELEAQEIDLMLRFMELRYMTEMQYGIFEGLELL